MNKAEAIERLKQNKAAAEFYAGMVQNTNAIENELKDIEAMNMAIEALSKPNYETDTEVRLAVTNRNKDKVVLWDAFGEVEYYPNGEINCVHCPHYHETEDETGVHSHCGSRGRLIDADALVKAFEGCMPLSEDTIIRTIRTAPTIQADRPHGEWVQLFDNTWECTNCEQCEQFGEVIESTSDFCPKCGARMKGGAE